LQQKKKDLKEMNKVNIAAYDNEIFDLKMTTLVNFLLFLITLFVGTMVMSLLEGWDFTTAAYWSAVTICTVGYGDVTPDTDDGKVFTIFFALIGCILSVKGFTELIRFPILLRLKQSEMDVQKQFLEGLSEKTLKNIIENKLFERIPNLKVHSDEIKKSEFIVMLLTLMGKLNEKDILLAATIFDKLDSNNDGKNVRIRTYTYVCI
jgi:voltage-gated potassium channel